MERVRIINWNLHGSAKPRLDAVVDLLMAHEPDVVVLQEVRHNQARRICGLMGWRRPAWAFKHNPYWPLWWRAEGLAVLSRHRLAPLATVLLTPGVSRRSYRRRVLLPVEVLLDEGRRLLLIDGHLSSGPLDDEARRAQVEHLVAILPGGLPEIVAGDLNDEPTSPALVALIEAGFVDVWAAAGEGPGFTIPANAPRRRIDYVLVRGGVRVADVAVIDDLGAAMSGLSDHRPVLATLELEG